MGEGYDPLRVFVVPRYSFCWCLQVRWVDQWHLGTPVHAIHASKKETKQKMKKWERFWEWILWNHTCLPEIQDYFSNEPDLPVHSATLAMRHGPQGPHSQGPSTWKLSFNTVNACLSTIIVAQRSMQYTTVFQAEPSTSLGGHGAVVWGPRAEALTR